MAIIDDYAGIAAAVRRIQAERSRPLSRDDAPNRSQPAPAYVTARGALKIEIRPGPQPRGGPVLRRLMRAWITD